MGALLTTPKKQTSSAKIPPTSSDKMSDAKPASTSPIPFKHYPSAQTDFKPPEIANGNAFLGDVFSSASTNPTKPISSGFYRLQAGPALDYTYTYDEMKIILEGEFLISDGSGQKVHAKKGDVFFFQNGAKIRFEIPEGVEGALAFYCGQRKEGEA